MTNREFRDDFGLPQPTPYTKKLTIELTDLQEAFLLIQCVNQGLPHDDASLAKVVSGIIDYVKNHPDDSFYDFQESEPVENPDENYKKPVRVIKREHGTIEIYDEELYEKMLSDLKEFGDAKAKSNPVTISPRQAQIIKLKELQSLIDQLSNEIEQITGVALSKKDQLQGVDKWHHYQLENMQDYLELIVERLTIRLSQLKGAQ